MTATGLVLPDGAATAPPSTAPVTVVVVTAGVTAYLRRTLAGVAAQTRRPSRVLLVDVGGPAGAQALLDAAFVRVGGVRTAYTQLVAAGFGAAVDAGLARLDAVAGDGAAADATRWLWLLHDDSAPAADALAELVRAVGQAPSVVVAGAKQRTWTDPERLLEVGVTTTRSGRRITGVLPGELDQGQHDARCDVLGVGLAGALVRTDAWRDLGGTDPALGPFGDGLELCRRARLAGHRVVVVPSAVVRHAQASLYGLRDSATDAPPGALVDDDGDGAPNGGDPRRSAAARRRSQVHARLVAAPLLLLPLVAVVALVAAPVRALRRMLGSDPGLARAELRGGWSALLRPLGVLSARRRVRRAARLPRRTLRPLQAGWREVWAALGERREARTQARGAAPRASELELGELAALATRRRTVLAVVMAVLAAATVLAFGSLLAPVLSGARLTGGAVAFAGTSWHQLVRAVSGGWVANGLGSAGPADPLLRLLAVPAVLTGGDLAPVVAVLLLAAVPLAGWAAWAAAGAATRSVALRAWAALAWGLAPTLLVAVGSGRLGAVLVHVALPWAALALARALGVQRVDAVLSGLVTMRAAGQDAPAPDEPEAVPVERSAPVAPDAAPVFGARARGSVPALAGAALAVAAVLAGAPALAVPMLLTLVVVAAAAGRRGRRLALVPLPGLLLLAPLVARAVTGPDGWRLLLADPGAADVAAPAGALARLLGLPTAAAGAAVPGWLTSWLPGWVPGWVPGRVSAAITAGWPGLVGLVVVALAVLALLRGRPVGRTVRTAWLVAVTGLAAATVLAGVPVVADASSTGPAFLGPSLSLAGAGLLAAALLGADRVTVRLGRYAFGWRQQLAAVTAVLAVVVTLTGGASWLVGLRAGGGLQLRAVTGSAVPAVAQQAFAAPAGSRVLVLRAAVGTGPVVWQLWHADGAQLVDQAASLSAQGMVGAVGSGRPAAADAATTEAATVVAALASGSGVDESVPLSALAVAHVLVPATAAGVDDTDPQAVARARLVGVLDATAGLQRVTSGAEGTVWRVAAPSAQSDRTVVTAWARLVPAGADPTSASTVATAVAGDGTGVRTTVVAASTARRLVLAQRADPHWRAWLDGVPLQRAQVGWRLAFTVPAGAGGTLVVRDDDAGARLWSTAQLVVGALVVLLAVPWPRRRGGWS